MRDACTVHWQQHIDYIHLEDYKREVQSKRVFSSGNVHEPVKGVPSPVAKETMVRREEMNDVCLRQ